jgi:hypothetical protein
MADFYCGVAAIREDDLLSGREPRLLRHTGGLRYADVFPLPPAPYSAGGMDLGRGGDFVRVSLRPRYVAAQRETSASPWRSGYGVRQVLAPQS